jgi:adenine deaminase
MDRGRLLAVARGDAEADLALVNGRVVNVFTGEVLEQPVAVAGGIVAAVGEPRQARETVDLEGRFLCPGLIDAHVHIESSMVTPFEFARAVVPRGTTAVVCDPHEIANVTGIDGIRWMLEASAGLPLGVLVTAPSCVPASHLATAGAELSAADLAALRDHSRVLGLAEVMNVPGVVLHDPGVHAKLDAFAGRPLDGHAPALGGGWLQAYAAAGIGTDHETLTAAEATARLRLGMRVLLRQSTAAHNLVELLPAVTPETSSRCALCTDDRHPHDLIDEGHLDHLLRLAVAHGLEPVTAIRMATLNVAEAYRLADRGAIAPGRRADLVVFEDLESFDARGVWSAGVLVAADGRPSGAWRRPPSAAGAVRGRLRVDPAAIDLRVPAEGRRVRVIGLVPGQLVTESQRAELEENDGFLIADPARDIAKLAVIERHRGTGNVGLGFIRGLGLKRGAIAGTVAHDHHNLMIAGVDDPSMRTAAAAVVAMGGGLAAALDDRVLATLPLPIGGLMSENPLEAVRSGLDRLLGAARRLGSPHPDPLMALSFAALEVIPALRLTDHGLVDVERFELVPLYVD